MEYTDNNSLKIFIEDLNNPKIEDFYHAVKEEVVTPSSSVTAQDYYLWFLNNVIIPERDKKLQSMLLELVPENSSKLISEITENLSQNTRNKLESLPNIVEPNVFSSLIFTINNLYIMNSYKDDFLVPGAKIKDEEIDDFVNSLLSHFIIYYKTKEEKDNLFIEKLDYVIWFIYNNKILSALDADDF